MSTVPGSSARRWVVASGLAGVLSLVALFGWSSWAPPVLLPSAGSEPALPSTKQPTAKPTDDCWITATERPDCLRSGWQRATKQVIAGHRGALLAVAVDPQGQLLASAGEDGSINLLRLSDGRFLFTLAVPDRKLVRALSFRPDKPRELAAAGDGPIRIWKLDGRHHLQLAGHGAKVWTLAWGKGGILYSTGSDGTTRWETGRGLRIGRRGGQQPLFAGALSADGRSFMTGGSDGNIRIWDAGLRRTTLQLKAHSGGVRTLAVEPQGRWLISGGWDHTAKIWRMADGRLVRVLRGHTDRIVCAAISPDGAVLATAGRDRTVRLWDLQTRQPLHTLTGHRDWVLTLAFSPDSRTLVSAGKDAAVHIWRRSE